jgi:hypothetical protein
MAIYSATFSAVGVTAAQDVFEIAAPSDSYVMIREIRIGQYSDFGDAAAEILSVLVIRNHTTTGSGGSAVTPVNWQPVTGGLTATSTVAANNTTVATSGTTATLISDTMNVAAGWWWEAPRDRQGKVQGLQIKPSQRLVVRITAPADSLTMNGTLVFEELGQFPA